MEDTQVIEYAATQDGDLNKSFNDCLIEAFITHLCYLKLKDHLKMDSSNLSFLRTSKSRLMDFPNEEVFSDLIQQELH